MTCRVCDKRVLKAQNYLKARNERYRACPNRMGLADYLHPIRDETLRFCVNYCKLNALRIRDSHQILCINKCIDWFGNSSISRHCKLTGYRCKIAKEYQEKAALKFPHGFFHLRRPSVALKNRPWTFQWAIAVVLTTLECQLPFCI